MIARLMLCSLLVLLPIIGFADAPAATAEASPATPLNLNMKTADQSPSLVRVFLVLSVGIVIAVVAVLGIKKYSLGVLTLNQKNHQELPIKHLQSKKLSMKLAVHLVEVGGIQYVVAESGDTHSLVKHEQGTV